MPEQIRYFPVMVLWLGFNQIKIDIEHSERKHGTTAYNFRKHLRLAADIILAFSDRPLRIVVYAGLSISMFSFILAFYFLWQGLVKHYTVTGFASVIVSIWFLSGAIIFVLGITGLYLGKIFEQVKGRPLYIIGERCGN